MNPPDRVEITRFPEGKRIAVTTSFDDNQTFDRRIVAAFNEWGLKATSTSTRVRCSARASQQSRATSPGASVSSSMLRRFRDLYQAMKWRFIP